MNTIKAGCSDGVLFNKKSMKLKYVRSNSNALDLQVGTAKIEEVANNFKNDASGCVNLNYIQR